MSNIIPPLVSNTPPPMLPEDDEEDYFGDFAAANDYSYDDGLSLPSTPHRSSSIPPSTYQNVDVSPPSESNEEKQVNFPADSNEFKDNTSQDSVISIVTSDSGLSEIHSSCSDEPPELLSDPIKDKDYLDVRNLDETIIPEKDHKDKRKEVEDCVVPENSEEFMESSNIVSENVSFEDCEEMIKADTCDETNIHEILEKDVGGWNEKSIFDVDEFKEATEEFVEEVTDSTLKNVDDVTYEEISEHEGEDDDFANFESAVVPEISNEVVEVPEISNEIAEDLEISNEIKEIDDDFGDFADFPTETNDVVEDDDFDDFADYSSAPNAEPVVQEQESLVDNRYLDIINLFSQKPNRNDNAKLSNLIREIFNEAFPANGNEEKVEMECSSQPNMLDGCKLWDRIDDVENLPPLQYKWENSECYKKYLNVINIDIRNILYGSNLNMPRFAANLGVSPLEPLKPVPVEIVSKPVIKKQVLEEPPPNDLIPAEFDNALNYTRTSGVDLEEFINSFTDVRPNCDDRVTSPAVTIDIDAWEYWTRCNKSKKESEPEEIIPPIEKELPSLSVLEPIKDTESVKSLKFSDFEVSQQIEQPIQQSLKPTTLDLPQPIAVQSSIEQTSPEDDEFSNFHSVPTPSINFQPAIQQSSFQSLPIQNEFIESFQAKIDKPKIPEFIESKLRETHISSAPVITEMEFKKELEPAWLQPTVLTPELSRKIPDVEEKVIENPPNVGRSAPVIEEEEDDFADFQAANNIPPPPVIQPQPTSPLHTQLVLNPSILTATLNPLEPIKLASKPNVQINWPDPGILESDLERLSNLNSNKVDDEWSDFVSVTKPTKHEPQPKPVDDDWSDFVSNNAPPTASVKQNWIEPPNFTSWNSPSPQFTPNIISNPSHFDYKYSNYQSSSKYQTHTTLQTMKGKKNTVSTISSLPELDFMTPKSIIKPKGSKK